MKKIDLFFIFILFFTTVTSVFAQDEDATDCALPGPENLVSPTQNPTSFTLTWDPVPLALLYHVEVFDINSGLVVASFNTSTTSTVVDGLTPGTYYKVAVSATACPQAPAFGGPSVIIVPTSIIIVDIILQQHGCSAGSMVEQKLQSNIKVYNLASDGSQTQQIEVYNPSTNGGKYRFLITPVLQNLQIIPLDSFRWYGQNLSASYRILENGIPQFEVSYANLLNSTTNVSINLFNPVLKMRSGPCDINTRENDTQETPDSAPNVVASPNPFTDYLEIHNTPASAEIWVFSLDGKPYYHGYESIIRTASWPKGLYLLKTQYEQTTRVYKLLKLSEE